MGEGGGWRWVHGLEALLVINSPIFSLRFVYMAVGASSHFASFVLEQVLDTFSFAGQFHFKIIVHFPHRLDRTCPPLPFRSFAREATRLLHRARVWLFGLVAFPGVEPSFLQPSVHMELLREIICTGGDVRCSGVVQVEGELEMYSFLLLLRFSQPVSVPKRLTSLGSDDVFTHGTVVKRREDSPAAEKEPERIDRQVTPRGNAYSTTYGEIYTYYAM